MSNEDESDYDMAALVREAIECLPNGFCIMDGGFRPILANRIAREAFGTYFALLDGGASFADANYASVRHAMPHLSDAECKVVADRIADHVIGGKPLQLKSFDGRVFNATYRVMSDDRYVAVYLDITQMKQRERELKALKHEADTANQAKSAFLANMSHEIRTPLNGVLGMAQVLAQSDLGPEYREQVEVILESGKTLRTLMDDVLDLSKIEAGHMELVPADKDLIQALKRQYDLWLPRAEEKGLDLRLHVGEAVPTELHFDSIRFGQCLSNLISNAIKFTERGHVVVDVSARGLPGGIEISVAVSDSGIGMSRETAARLFTPFTQADSSISRRFGGTGLGLVITRKLAQLMGGDVALQSIEGAGSTFTLTMLAQSARQPVASDMEAPRDLGEAKVLPVPRGKHVLLVDDHPLNRRVGRLFLEPKGYQVTDAENGQQALELLANSEFDLVLLDIHMPVLDGIETLKRMRSSGHPRANLPVIALTADAMSGDRERYLAEGMNGYLSKPIDQWELLSELTRLLGDGLMPETGEVVQVAAAEPASVRVKAPSQMEPSNRSAAMEGECVSDATERVSSVNIGARQYSCLEIPMLPGGSTPEYAVNVPANDYDMAALAQEAIDCLPDGFAIMDSELVPIMSNQISRESFTAFYAAIDGGESYREASFASRKFASPGASDDECWREVDAIQARFLSGKSVELRTALGRTLSMKIRPMRHGRYVAVSVDITEHIAREEELELSRQQAEAANEAKSTFLANMSHEIRTPLNGILGMAQVLMQGRITAAQREQAELVLISGKALKTILDDVLDLSKIEAGRMELAPVDQDLRLLLRQQIRPWRDDAEQKGVRLKLEMDASVSDHYRFDAVRVGQCLANLLSNAVKFTESGEITVHVSGETGEKGTAISVAVADHGIGMSEETIRKLFQPFSQADDSIARRFGGSGLGLVISRKLARLMGGDLTVASRPGEGSTFTLSFIVQPAQKEMSAAKPSPPKAHRQMPSPPRGRSAKHILLVDDNALNRRVGNLFLKPEGYRITEAENGLEALERLAEDHFDIVLLDIHMPVLDGLATLKRIRTANQPWSNVPVIALTADAMSGDRERYLAEGMNGYISKPIEQRDLLAEIARLVGRGRSGPVRGEGAAA